MVLLQIYNNIIISLFALSLFMCLEIIPERAVVKYINPKYIKELKVTALKRSRTSPYYINWDGEIKSQFGNNVSVSEWILSDFTIRSKLLTNINIGTFCFATGTLPLVSMKLLEYLSGRWVPTPLQKSFKLCDFFENEPYLGQMYNKQLKSLVRNWTCPLPPGEYHFHDLVLHMEDFPFNIPFTWASVSVKTRSDVEFFVTKTKETMITGTMDFTIIQKPHNNKKIKTNSTIIRNRYY